MKSVMKVAKPPAMKVAKRPAAGVKSVMKVAKRPAAATSSSVHASPSSLPRSSRKRPAAAAPSSLHASRTTGASESDKNDFAQDIGHLRNLWEDMRDYNKTYGCPPPITWRAQLGKVWAFFGICFPEM